VSTSARPTTAAKGISSGQETAFAYVLHRHTTRHVQRGS
jgi:hypothetical protein